MILGNREADGARPALPWNTAPTGLGWSRCAWCDRDIYLPALPCSVAPPPGLLDMATAPGQGDRCKWELHTRTEAAMDDGQADAETRSPRSPCRT